MSKFKKIGLVLVILIFLAIGGFVAWAVLVPEPMPDALAALVSDEEVTVTEGKWTTFVPTGKNPDIGLIFYPGGRVDHRAYAPAARELAKAGYQVTIVPMPLNLAVFNPNAATDVMAAYPDVSNWAVGGHSLGGAMAAQYASEQSNAVDGLVLWAAYPAGSADLSDRDLEVTSVYGLNDGVAAVADVRGAQSLLPENTQWVAITGGNHAQFGWYGEQAGDNSAVISREEQQQQVVQATRRLLDSIARE